MRKLNHLIYIPFTGLGLQGDGFKGDDWYKHRETLFKKFLLKSLENQTNRDFTLWLSFRPEEKDHPTTKKIEKDLKNFNYVITFDGVMMYDDRGTWHNFDLEERLDKSLEEVKKAIKPSEWIYCTLLGSDDMFHKDAVDEMQQIEAAPNKAGYYLKGYAFHTTDGTLAEWNRTDSCSKHTIVFPYDIFFNAKNHLSYVGGYESHEDIPKVYDAVKLSDWHHGCTIHGNNISTIWDHPYRGDIIKGDKKKQILKDLGIYDTFISYHRRGCYHW